MKFFLYYFNYSDLNTQTREFNLKNSNIVGNKCVEGCELMRFGGRASHWVGKVSSIRG